MLFQENSASFGRKKSGPDLVIVLLYFAIVIFGIVNIYSSENVGGAEALSTDLRCVKQAIWLGISLVASFVVIFLINPRFFDTLSPLLYIIVLGLLVSVIFIGSSIKGSHSWFSLGPLSFQPAEVSKITTSLFLASIMSYPSFNLSKPRDFITVAGIILVPMAVIVLEQETGSALVYCALIFMLYREGLSGWLLVLLGLVIVLFISTIALSPYWAIFILLLSVYCCEVFFAGKYLRNILIILCASSLMVCLPWLYEWLSKSYPQSWLLAVKPLYAILFLSAVVIVYFLFTAVNKRDKERYYLVAVVLLGLGLIYSADYIFHDVLKDYQRGRIEVLLGMREDPLGVGYNVTQSMIAIGSGGLSGKGFLHGTQTTLGFIPEQSTDFIFCTVGEQWGFLGSLAIIFLYGALIFRIIFTAEKTRAAFTRIYGYCCAGFLFLHVVINIGMTIGLMPVIGIPLPMFSYGGSSLLSFTVLLSIYIALLKSERR